MTIILSGCEVTKVRNKQPYKTKTHLPTITIPGSSQNEDVFSFFTYMTWILPKLYTQILLIPGIHFQNNIITRKMSNQGNQMPTLKGTAADCPGL